MSDRVAVFNHGRIEQVGTPREIYEHPATAFVAGFVGTSNVLTAELAQHAARPAGTVHRAAGADSHRRDGRAGRRARSPSPGTVARRAVPRCRHPVRGAWRTDAWSTRTTSARHVDRQRARAHGARWRRPRSSCVAALALVRRLAASTSPDQQIDATEGGTPCITTPQRDHRMRHMRRARQPRAARRSPSQPVAATTTSIGRRRAEQRARRGRGRAQPHRLGRLRRGRQHRPGVRLGHAVRGRRPAARSTSKIGNTSDEMFQLMQTGEYDGVSASGDASVRLIDAGEVAPVNTDLITNYADISAVPQGPALQLAVTARTTASRTAGAPTCLMYNTDVVTPAARLVGRRVRRELAVHGQGHGVRRADLHRRRGAVPDDDPARPRHHGPVRARPGAVRRRGRAAEGAERRSSASTGTTTPRRRARSSRARPCSAPRGRSSTTWPRPTGHRSTTVLPKEGSTGWSRHLDGLVEGQAPELHVHVDGLHHLARGAGPGRRTTSVRRRPTRRPATLITDDPTHCDVFKATDEAFAEGDLRSGRRHARSASTARATTACRSPTGSRPGPRSRAESRRVGGSARDAGAPPIDAALTR